MRNVELLAPAGNFDCLKAAVNNGADAVYLGGKNFSARAFANNFDEEELIRAIRYAHLRDVRIFVTLNTLLSEKEFANAIRMADFYYRNKVDALLIQDLGLYYYLKKKYPDFELHCSTQMHVHNLQGVKNAKKLGFKRVVLARESDLSLIEEACKEDIEIETFVHGAICVSYSGQCLMSSSVKGRSANKGMCAQCCRLRYELYDEEENRVKTDTDYLLSPKDMFLLEDIPALIKAGVSSFKIEGRMKSPAYVGLVTRYYRTAIDAALKGEKFIFNDDDLKKLKVLFNRGFTNDLLHDKNDLFGQKTPNHLGIPVGETLYYRKKLQYIRLNDDLNQFDGIRINDFGCIINKLYLDGKLVSKAQKGDIAAIETDMPLKGIVYKTQDSLLEKQIAETKDKKVPLSVSVTVLPEKSVEVCLKHDDQTYTYVSDVTAQKAIKAPLDEDNIIRQFSKLNETVYELSHIDVHTKDAFLSVKQLNEIRRNAVASFDEYRLESFHKDPIYADYLPVRKADLPDAARMIQKDDLIKLDGREFALNPVINKDSRYTEADKAVVSEFGGLFQPYEEKIAYYTLNCLNSYTYEFLKGLGFDHIVLSSEINDQQIADLIEAYEKRNDEKIRPFVFVQGDRVLMYIKSDPFGKYLAKDKIYHLKENKNIYALRRHNGVYELIEKDCIYHASDSSYSPLFVTLKTDR
ncbi:MAG: U32 family peptidase [Erysipelotrichaceae bacterium]|nr:U32 family peptidase [Erysipelotrichaceae bacterium]